ncbi:MAG: hypothetical protein JWN53_1065 [Gemmatimonadetes bacterium]|nr:hypothetical protein [Gemmatimonadota bacterium]
MKKITLAVAVMLVAAPLIARAQSARGSVNVESHARVDASSQPSSQESEPRRTTLSADGQAKVDANLRAARARHLPEQPIRERVAEGSAKGASEVQIVAASGRALAELQASSDAMARAGRTTPSGEETTRGAQLLARGYTIGQLEAVARRAPSDRSLVVAFETLASLQARGVSTTRAATQVESTLGARATDAQLHDLAINGGAATQVDGAFGGGRTAGSVSGGAAAGIAGAANGVAGSAAAGEGAGAAATLGRGTAGVAGAANGAVGAVVGGRP